MDKIKKAAIMLIAVITSITATAQELAGSWIGKLSIGDTQLNLVFNIAKDNNGTFTCTFDSPDQGATGIPAEITVTEETKIKITIPAIMAQYDGELAGDILKGKFTQGGFSFPIDMKPGKVQLNRPQTPKEPYPYTTDEVTFNNNADNVTLCGTLTYPVGFDKMAKGTTPLVVMVTGSGLQNRDEEIFGHKPFLVLADFLARNGIASLRYDDRGAGKSTGDPASTTTESNMRDALTAVEAMRHTGEFGKIGVLGHSEGGIIAFMLGAQGKADFIISMAGPGVRGDSIIIEQNRTSLENAHIPADIITAHCKAIKHVLNAISDGTAMEQPDKTVQDAITAAGTPLPQPVVNSLKNVISECTPWFKYYITYNPSDDIRNTKCPVMAINGSKDTQVQAQANLQAIRSLLPENSNNNIKEYNGLNHLFQHCTTGLVTEYGQIEETMSPEVMADIAKWINTVK